MRRGSLGLLVSIGIAGALCACGDDAGAGPRSDAGCLGPRVLRGSTPLPEDVDAIVEDNCRMCHTDPPKNFAPMPLLTWEDVQAPRKLNPDEAVYEAIARRIDDANAPMPPKPAPNLSDAERAAWPKLTEDEKAALREWIAACAPPG